MYSLFVERHCGASRTRSKARYCKRIPSHPDDMQNKYPIGDWRKIEAPRRSSEKPRYIPIPRALNSFSLVQSAASLVYYIHAISGEYLVLAKLDPTTNTMCHVDLSRASDFILSRSHESVYFRNISGPLFSLVTLFRAMYFRFLRIFNGHARYLKRPIFFCVAIERVCALIRPLSVFQI